MTSNIDATVPPTNGPLVSAQIRDNFATAKAEISALQTAIAGAGDVDGPVSSTAGHLAVFADATGKVISDGGAVPIPALPAGATNTVQYNAGSGAFGGAALAAGQPLVGVNAAAPVGGTVLGAYGGGLVLLEQHTASSSATLDFTTGFSNTYDTYLLQCSGIIPVTNNVTFQFLFGTGGGPTYAAANYQWAGIYNTIASATPIGYKSSGSSAALDLLGGIGNGTGQATSITLWLKNTRSSSAYKIVDFTDTTVFQDGTVLTIRQGAVWSDATVVTACRLQMSSGNISSGTARLYGVSKA